MRLISALFAGAKHCFTNLILTLFLCGNLANAADAETENGDLMIVFDASGSMWGQIDGTAKITIAQDAFAQISKDWAETGQSAGLIAYGHRRKGDCGDIELLSHPSQDAAREMAARVEKLTPTGKTPLSAAVRMAAETLKYTENVATVILLSDGIETCDLDPCAMGSELERLGVNFTAHVIGFDIQNDADRAQLQCLAENTGGQYMDADNAADLDAALQEVSSATRAPAPPAAVGIELVIQETEGTARPVNVTLSAQPASKSEPARVLGTLTGAEQVITGLSTELPAGEWILTAIGDGGQGEMRVSIAEQNARITIPFSADNATFAYLGPDEIAKGGDVAFQLKSLKPLQENATYYVMLAPAGASSFDQNITFAYIFGTDPQITEHTFYGWEYDLQRGAYELIVQEDGLYSLEDNLGRFPFVITE